MFILLGSVGWPHFPNIMTFYTSLVIIAHQTYNISHNLTTNPFYDPVKVRVIVNRVES